MNSKKSVVLVLFLLVLVVFSWQCTEKYPADATHVAAISDGCVTCHTDADLLKKVAAPLPHVDGEAGEG